MSIDCFDPTVFSSASSCVQALAGEGFSLGHRLGARVFGLGRRGVRFSLAFLDEAANGGEALDILKNSAWNDIDLAAADKIVALLQGTMAISQREPGYCVVMCRDEYEGPEVPMTVAAVDAGAADVAAGGADVAGEAVDATGVVAVASVAGVVDSTAVAVDAGVADAAVEVATAAASSETAAVGVADVGVEGVAAVDADVVDSMAVVDTADTAVTVVDATATSEVTVDTVATAAHTVEAAASVDTTAAAAEAASRDSLARDNVSAGPGSSVVLRSRAGSGQASGSLLPMVLGEQASGAFHGVLWDPRRMEEAALVLLDGEDDQKLVESFRYLFRASLACAQDPTSLMVRALRRGHGVLSREVAVLVRDNLDRELGRALGELISEDPKVTNDAIHFFQSPAQQRYLPVLQAILIPTLIPLVERPGFRTSLLPSLPQLATLVGQASVDKDGCGTQGLEALLDALLAGINDMELHQRFAVSAFVVALGAKCRNLADYLIRRLQATVDASGIAFFGSILSRLTLNDEQKAVVIEAMVQIFVEHGGQSGMGRRLRATFRGLGRDGLRALSQPALVEKMDEAERILLVHLWHDFRQASVPLPAHEVFVSFVMTGLTAADRGMLYALVHTEQLGRPEVVRELCEHRDRRRGVVAFLMDEVYRLEEPDDAAVLDVLKNLGFVVLRHSFELVRDEVILESGGEASRVVVFGKLGRRLDYNDAQRDELRGMVEELLSYDYFEKSKLPVVWTGLGEVGAIPAVGDALRATIVARLGANMARHCRAKVDSLLVIYQASGEEVRAEVEDLLRQVVCSSEPERVLLQACLCGLQTLLANGPMLVHGEELVRDLCRTVLARVSEQSLDSVMNEILSPDAEGDGVRLPVAWNKEDRDNALRILGQVACHSDVPSSLHRMVVFRLFSFLDDWFDGIESGRDLYAFRDTPLWAILEHILRVYPSNDTVSEARAVAVRVMEDYRKNVEGLCLDRRENAQRFLLGLLRVDTAEMIKVRGIDFDLRRAILKTVMDIARRAPADSHATEHLLRELFAEKVLPSDLQMELEVRLDLCAPEHDHCTCGCEDSEHDHCDCDHDHCEGTCDHDHGGHDGFGEGHGSDLGISNN